MGTNRIHRSAVVSERARIGQDVSIHEGAVIRAGVTIGSGTIIRPGCIIGTGAEMYGRFNSEGIGVVIGEDCVISDGVKIHSGTQRTTKIGNRVHVLAGGHVGHDAILEDDVTISVMVVVGGHAVIMRGANVGMNATILQRQVVGSYCMIGANASIDKKTRLWPGNVFAGVPAKLIKVNTIGLQRGSVSDDMLMAERARFESLLVDQGINK